MMNKQQAISRVAGFLLSACVLNFLFFAIAQKAEVKTADGLTLKPARKVEFSTSEGTWMSLDISPDGRTILFDLLGDIYTLPITGGEAKPLLTGMSFDSQPRYSPDGRLIAFISDRDGADNLWIANADGSGLQQLSHETHADMFSPAWAVDGGQVIVSRVTPARTGIAELWSYPKTGAAGGAGNRLGKPINAQPSPLVSAPPPGAYGPQPAADGRWLLYSSVTPRVYRSTEWARAQVMRLDLTPGAEEPLTFRRENAFRPVISPDGKLMVYATRYESQTALRVREMANGEERWLKWPIQRDDIEAYASRDLLPNYTFTPDGKDLLISYGGKIHRLEVSSGKETDIPFTAKMSLDIGPKLDFPLKLDQGPVRARIAQLPVLSPDGRRLAFSALAELYVMEMSSGKPRRLTGVEHAREFHPTWSPDGQWIAFVTWSSQGGHVWKVRSDSSAIPQQLTRVPAFYRDPVWSPDGKRIVAIRAPRQSRLENPSPQDAEIISIPAEGGIARLIAPARGLGHPHFGSDPDRIFFSSFQGLVSVRVDGADRRIHLQVTGGRPGGRPAPAQDIQLSPDGSRVLALVGNQLYLLNAPALAGETQTINVNTAAGSAQKLTRVGADSFAWADGGKTVTWTVGASFHRLPLAKVSSRTDESIEIAVEKPRVTPQGSIVLRGARVVTMHGNEVIEDAELVITGNRIAAAGKRGTVKIPSNARILDLKGRTIIPGLIDIHAHWDLSRSVLDTEMYSSYANLAYGVTSVRDPQSMTNDIFAYSDLVEAGEMTGPRIFSTGPGVFTDTNFSSYEEARDVIGRYRNHYRTHLIKAYLTGNRRQRQWVVEACRELQMMPTTEGGADFKMDLTHAIDGFSGNEHGLPNVPIYNDVVKLFAQSGTTYTPTLMVAFGGPFALYQYFARENFTEDPKLRRFTPQNVLSGKVGTGMLWFPQKDYIFPQIAAGAAAILKAGGNVGLGGHGELQGLGTHWEMWLLASGGMSNHDVLRVATINSARAIGYAQDLGSIETGKMADLIILDKNPLIDIRNTNSIRYVMKNGELLDGETLDQLWPQKKALPAPWWLSDKPAPRE
ncbi:MAG: PD40 domain-containing protein [Acidobacteria bacterium]|nr:PD40 domain-containing protein [Acidobacteriota bacterium]